MARILAGCSGRLDPLRLIRTGVGCPGAATLALVTDRLEGPRRKLARARRHFEDVRAILDQLDEDNASLAKQDYNEAEGRYEFSLQDDWTLHPDLPLIVGDVLHNARSALDHLAWALAREPGTHTGFPILDPARPSPRNDFYGRKQLATIKRAVKMKLERIQSYKSKHLMRSLWWLNQLDIADKHHLVLPTAHNAPGFGTMMPDGYDIKSRNLGSRTRNDLRHRRRPLRSPAPMADQAARGRGVHASTGDALPVGPRP